VKVFVYLTDTAEGDGQHEMFRKSHLKTPLALVPIRRYERAEILAAMPGLELRKICGPAGFTFIENTFTFHRGTKPTRNDRLIAISPITTSRFLPGCWRKKLTRRRVSY